MKPKPKMRNPEAWIGKRVDHLDYEAWWMAYGRWDDCQRRWYADDDRGNHIGLHSFICPETEPDWKLQEALHVEEAMSYCPGAAPHGPRVPLSV